MNDPVLVGWIQGAAAAFVDVCSSLVNGAWLARKPTSRGSTTANAIATAVRRERRGTPAGAAITLMSWERQREAEQEALLGPGEEVKMSLIADCRAEGDGERFRLLLPSSLLPD